MKNTSKESIELIRLGLISGIFSVDEVQHKLYMLIEQNEVPDIHMIDAVMSSDIEAISQHLSQVIGICNPIVVECLMASELLARYSHQNISPEKIAFVLYLQLMDKKTICWQKDENRIMKFDDGFRLINRRIGNEEALSTELISFLRNKIENCSFQ
ncbi:MAG: hypothetical protein KJ063_24410 [Anaerolineae bacterium]|nr:hypothetical protein [Anaerolineae bacterium]